MVMALTLVPPHRRQMMGAFASICIVTAGILGPVLGGAITLSRVSSTWPWIFWINLPIAGSALIAMLIAWPSDKSKTTFTLTALSNVDFLGALLLLAASTLLVFALQEAGSYAFAWDDAAIVASLVLSVVCFILFLGWQYWLVKYSGNPHRVVFPISLLANRVIAAAIV